MPWPVLLLWALFLLRAAFYCAAMPLWEGWDEYAHFAWIDHWIARGTLPGFEDRMAREVEESLRLAPLNRELEWMGPPHLTYEAWWALPEGDREERELRLRTLAPDYAPSAVQDRFYEAQQPPLYYWVASGPLLFVRGWALPDRVLAARLFSALLASFAVPFTWLAARRRGIIAAALMAVAPGFAMDTFRVANDGLAIALFAMCLWLLRRENTAWWQVGLVAGLALLTKSYMLLLLPLLWGRWKAMAVAVVVGGWWYARNAVLGYSLTGWVEHAPAGQVAAQVVNVYWPRATEIMAKSFTWFGGWSFLTLKSWVYWPCEAAGVMAAAMGARRERLAGFACGLFAAAMVYGEMVYSAAHPGAILPGWYFWPAGAALAIVVASGSRWLAMALIAMLAAMDLYGMSAVAMPYYAGLVMRGHVDAGSFFAALRRLHVAAPLAVLWAAATVSIPVVACSKSAACNRIHAE